MDDPDGGRRLVRFLFISLPAAAPTMLRRASYTFHLLCWRHLLRFYCSAHSCSCLDPLLLPGILPGYLVEIYGFAWGLGVASEVYCQKLINPKPARTGRAITILTPDSTMHNSFHVDLACDGTWGARTSAA